jgi:hypothetical protein
VHGILTDPARRRTRPYAARSLLSFLVSCAECGGPVAGKWSTAADGGRRSPDYGCRDRGCATVKQSDLDGFVEKTMIRWLSDPDVFAELTKVDNSAAAAQARADAVRLRQELEELYRDAEAGDVSPTIATRRERALQPQIADAERRAHEAMIPPVLRDRVGPEAAAAWDRADDEIKRQMVKIVADIRLKPSGVGGGRGRWYGRLVSERVEWRWLLGPDAGRASVPLTAPTAEERMVVELSRRPSLVSALGQLAHNAPLPQIEMSSRIGRSRAHTSALVQQLVDRGLVDRWQGNTRLPAGRRQVGRPQPPITLALTEAGHEIAAMLNGGGPAI